MTSTGLNLAGFANLSQRNRNTPAADAAPSNKREEAKIWLNFGYAKTIPGVDGAEPTDTFVSLARGIPLDQVEKFDLTKITRSTMATLRRDQNNFHQALMDRAADIKPGESAIICFDEVSGLGIEMRVRGEGAAPIEEEEGAPAPFSFR